MRPRAAFSEVISVLVITGMVAAVAVPKGMDPDLPMNEQFLKSDLEVYRGAIQAFHRQTGLYPIQLSDLATKKPPSRAATADGIVVELPKSKFSGPYLTSVASDPVSKKPLQYIIVRGKALVSPSAEGIASDGSRYENW
ncbi:MAG TPA: hypothetical protein PKA27_08105 [Fimbriimonadaceae bacterium]|nr:hypothetical protein [Fimbriimonadaceae bacterium]